MEFNPIFKRESQVRWRSWKPFALIFCYAMTLSCLLGWAYTDTASTNLIGGLSISESGGQIFRALQILQMAAWTLVVPILAAPLVSAERERGLLESLQLSGLSPTRIIAGKLAALIAFVLLIMLSVAPVMAVCFMMGGVSPEEFLKSLALQAAVIVLCASAGLYFSAHARRSLAAFRNVMIAIVVCGLGSAFAYDIWWWFVNDVMGASITDYPDWLDIVCGGLTILNPLRAQTAIFDGFESYGFTTGSAAAIWEFCHPQWFALAFWMLSALLLLSKAARGVRRNFALGQWIERKRYLTFRGGRLQWIALPAPAPSALQAQERTARTVLEMPLAQLVRFKNPILQREVKGKLRVRRFHKRASFFMCGMAGIGLLAYTWSILWVLGERNSRSMVWGLICLVALFLISLAVSLMSAGALSRERENGTWEMLHLSLMEPRQIILGKVLAPLVIAGSLLTIAMPLLLPCVRWLQFGESQGHNELGPAMDYALLTLLLLAVSTWFFSSLGLWMSWRCRSTVTAMSMTVVTLLVLLIAVPALITWANSTSSQQDNIPDWIVLWHPFFAFFSLMEPWRFDVNALDEKYILAYPPSQAFFSILVIFGMGCVILLDLLRRMNRARHAAKSQES